jgi:hypothetical protein
MWTIGLTILIAGCSALAQSQQGPRFGGVGSSLPPPNHVSTAPGNVLTPPPSIRAPHPRHQRTVVVPYPVFYGGYYGYDAPPPAPGYALPAGPPSDADQNQYPIVIINQNYRPDTVNPVLRDYSNTPLPESALKKFESPSRPYEVVTANGDEPTIYLIALRDHTIFPAVAYWMDGDTLNYITTEGSHNRITLDLVDREFSKQLNDERKVEFTLPKK